MVHPVRVDALERYHASSLRLEKVSSGIAIPPSCMLPFDYITASDAHSVRAGFFFSQSFFRDINAVCTRCAWLSPFQIFETFFEARPSAHVSGVRVLSTLGLFGEIPSSGCARNKSRWDAAVAAVYFR